MSEYSETRVLESTSVRVLDVARAAECVALVGGAGLAIATLSFPTALIAVALVGMAAVLRPRERVSPEAARIEMRRQLIQSLTSEGLVLRWRYAEIRKLPLGQSRSDALWSVRRDITVWLAASCRRVDRYPEIARILNSHRASGGLVDELDSALQRLGEIRRLCSISEKLKLPF